MQRIKLWWAYSTYITHTEANAIKCYKISMSITFSNVHQWTTFVAIPQTTTNKNYLAFIEFWVPSLLEWNALKIVNQLLCQRWKHRPPKAKIILFGKLQLSFMFAPWRTLQSTRSRFALDLFATHSYSVHLLSHGSFSLQSTQKYAEHGFSLWCDK